MKISKKKTYESIISYFYKFSQMLLQVLDKVQHKLIQSERDYFNEQLRVWCVSQQYFKHLSEIFDLFSSFL